MKYSKILKNNSGFTLVEMMVAVAIATLFIGYSYAAYLVHQKTFTTESQITEMQYSGGAAIDLIEKDIRESGFGVPDNPNIALGSSTYTTSLAITNAGGPDTITLLGGFLRIGTLTSNVNPGAFTITINWDGGITPTTSLPFLSLEGLTFLTTTGVTDNGDGTATITVSPSVQRFFPTGRVVYAIDVATYFVNGNVLYKSYSLSNGTADLNGDGLMDAPIAFNIDDIQFAQLDVAGAATTDPASTERIRVSILARTERAVQNELDPSVTSITLENNTTGTNDFFRRRVYRAEVSLRNPVRF